MKPDDKISKKNPFRVPEDYFDTLADRTMAAIREEEAGRHEDGQQSVQQQGRKGDAGYGDNGSLIIGQAQDLTVEVPDMTPGRTVKPGRVVSLRPFLALAAAILGFAILAAAMVRLISSDRPGRAIESGTSLYAELAAEEIDMYMLENELSITEAVNTELTEEAVPSEAIIEYLMNEDIDLDEIYELL